MIDSILKGLIARKVKEVSDLLESVTKNKQIDSILHGPTLSADCRFSKALKPKQGLAVIAEIKRRSPSVGMIATIEAPEKLASVYASGGAAAVSVLTDQAGFGGSIQDLARVSGELNRLSVPTLRKDFIFHPVQIAEAKVAGAGAILLIGAVFNYLREAGFKNTTSLKTMLRETQRMGLEALIEIHSEDELNMAVDAGAEIIGINQRNLNSFSLHPELFEKLAFKFPSHVICVAESGIRSSEDARKVRELGYHAVLVGEALVRSKSPETLIRALTSAEVPTHEEIFAV